jgi:hypothetical protein
MIRLFNWAVSTPGTIRMKSRMNSSEELRIMTELAYVPSASPVSSSRLMSSSKSVRSSKSGMRICALRTECPEESGWLFSGGALSMFFDE